MRTPRSLARLGVAGLALLALLGTACGGDDDASDAEAAPYVDAVTKDLKKDNGGDMALTDKQASCLAPGLVDVVGVKELRRARIEPKQLAEADSLAELKVKLPDDAVNQLTDLTGDCLDMGELRDMLGKTISTQLGPKAACIATEADDDAIAGVVAASVVGGEQAQSADKTLIDGAPAPCIEQLLLAAITQGQNLPEEATSCLADELDDDVSLRAFQGLFGGGKASEKDNAAVEAAFKECKVDIPSPGAPGAPGGPGGG